MIKKFNLFENLQQAENFVNLETKPKWVDTKNISHKYYNKLKEYLRDRGKLGWLYIFTLFLFNFNNKDTFDDIIQHIDLMIDHNIKFDADDFLKKHPVGIGVTGEELQYVLLQHIRSEYKKIEINKFIDNWAPGFLKKELKEKFFKKLENILFHQKYGANLIDDIDTELLRGKMSSFKTPEEWLDYVGTCEKNNTFENVKKIKNSNDVEIFYDDDEWLIYKPLTFESSNLIVFPYWCTINKYQYDIYENHDTYFVIFFNKKEKKNSIIIQIGNSYSIYDYYDNVILDKEGYCPHYYPAGVHHKVDDEHCLITDSDVFKIFKKIENKILEEQKNRFRKIKKSGEFDHLLKYGKDGPDFKCGDRIICDFEYFDDSLNSKIGTVVDYNGEYLICIDDNIGGDNRFDEYNIPKGHGVELNYRYLIKL